MRHYGTPFVTCVCLAGFTLVLAGCGGGEGEKKSQGTAPPAAALNNAAPGSQEAAGTVTVPPALAEADAPEGTTPLSDEECRHFAEQVVSALNANDIPALNAQVSWGAVLKAATANVPVAAELTQQFINQGLVSLDQPDGFWPQIIAQAGEGIPDMAHLLHVHGSGPRRAALIRILLPDGVAYLDLVLARKGGQLRAIDIFSFLSGEMVSQSIRRAYVASMASQNEGLANQLQGWERDLASSVKEIDAAMALLNGAEPTRFSAWLEAFGKFPAGLRGDKSLMLTRLAVARQTSDEAFTVASTDLRSTFVNDPSVDLVFLDLYAQAQQHNEVIITLNKLEKALGGDAYLKVWQANALVALNKHEEARQVIKLAVAQEPELRHAYWTLVMISLAERKYEETVLVLSTLEQKFAVEFDDFTKHPEYAEFVKSAEYENWMKNRSAAAPAATGLR